MKATMSKPVVLIVSACLLFQLCSGSELDEVDVVLSSGMVRGNKLVSVVNRSYFSFQGIPYAEPPVGHLRFKPAKPPKRWNGTLEAFKIPPACAQPSRDLEYPEIFSEDCLYINVFTPHLQPPGGMVMPVMVWIHGGKHYQGSSTIYKYGPDFLLTEDVVLVTFNYRMGVFGYLNGHTKSAQGNIADKDKVAALRWVQKEISKFGGDPGSVTIFGGSSGGSDVNCLYLSPMSQGLFHKAISESGEGCEGSFVSFTFDPAAKLAQFMDCPTSVPEDMVACLREVPAAVLAESQVNMYTPLPSEVPNPFSPTVEENYGEEVFIGSPVAELTRSSTSRVPYMMGVNSGEGLMDVKTPEENPTLLSDFERDIQYYLPSSVLENNSQETIDELIKSLKSFYFDNKPILFDSYYGFSNFMMDKKFTYFTAESAKSLSSHAPVYLYYFVFQGNFAIPRSANKLNLTGAHHGDELGYLFYRSIVIPEQKHMYDYPLDCAVVSKMVRLWTNFAKYGNPTPKETDGLLNVTWLPMTDSVTQHLVINATLWMDPTPLLAERVAMWEYIYSLAVNYEQDKVYVGVYILAVVFLLMIASLIYLLCTSTCNNDYENI